jgi:hypothetical protein
MLAALVPGLARDHGHADGDRAISPTVDWSVAASVHQNDASWGDVSSPIHEEGVLNKPPYPPRPPSTPPLGPLPLPPPLPPWPPHPPHPPSPPSPPPSQPFWLWPNGGTWSPSPPSPPPLPPYPPSPPSPPFQPCEGSEPTRLVVEELSERPANMSADGEYPWCRVVLTSNCTVVLSQCTSLQPLIPGRPRCH